MKIEAPYLVYVKTNADGYITDVNSSAFLDDLSGWMQIDSGDNDRFHHAQGNYFPQPLLTDRGAFRYRLTGGLPAVCTEAEIAEQEAAQKTDSGITLETRIAELEAQNEMLIQCILELSEIIYA